jgi:hypothetical protein
VHRRSNRLVRFLSVMVLLLGGFAARAQPTQVVIDDTQVFPESLTSTADGSIIIGGSGHGTIYRASPGASRGAAPGAAKATPWIAAEANKLGRVLGVYADTAANTLWVCSNDQDPKGNAADLKAFDLKTGVAKGDYPFPGGGLCNDVAVARGGTLYVTDTKGGRILTMKRGGSLDVWAADPKWVGIDGIALLPKGAILFNNVRQNQLVRVDRKPDGTAGAATELTLSQPVDGPDGMRAISRGRILLAENRGGKVDVVEVTGDAAKIRTIKDGFKFTPTAVTVVGNTIWVLEAKFAYRNDPALKDKDPGPFGATAVPLPAH